MGLGLGKVTTASPFPISPMRRMNIEEFQLETLWRCYQKGYLCMVRSGLFFRHLVRPAFSHVLFQRALPILTVYSRSNRTEEELPPGFSQQMEACPLSLRDLMHLDYAISLGLAEEESILIPSEKPIMDLPGSMGMTSGYIPLDTAIVPPDDLFFDDFDDFDEDLDDLDNDDSPPFDT